MTYEEFETLPDCLYCENPGRPDGCHKHPNNDDDWDEMEDPCEFCNGWKGGRYKELMGMSLEDANKMIEEYRKR